MKPAARYIPEGATRIASKLSTAVAYLYASRAGNAAAIAYVGNANTPAFHIRFRSAQRRMEYVSGWMRNADANIVRKTAALAERKAKLANPHGLKVGDVLTGQWGYDQTNVEFWQVTKLIGRRQVEIRELCVESTETGFMSGDCVPLPGKFTSKAPERKKVNETDSVKLYSFGCYLRKAEPFMVGGVSAGYRAQHWTSYA